MSGRIGPCEKCGYPDCEYIVGSFQNCDRCAGKIKHTYTLSDDSWGVAEWDADETTELDFDGAFLRAIRSYASKNYGDLP